MKPESTTFSFDVPFAQRQIVLKRGTFVCEIQADSLGDAISILRKNSVLGDTQEEGLWISTAEDDIELCEADRCELDLENLRLKRIVQEFS